MATTAPAPQAPSLQRALVIAGLLVIVDAFVMNQGAISLFFGFGLILIALPRVAVPPFGRPTYNFGHGAWGYVD